ncbi:uncharacterized protein LOC114361316, partial [Ostrinia furnacalis]|uniref:uncharacterized protein LOC114361316 n=1 Tax=Ostrinia furnacalis TaxID=93504 RepID=UPI00103D768C
WDAAPWGKEFGDCLHQPEKRYGYGDTATATFGASLEPGPEPPDYSSQLITLVTPVLWDAAPWGKEFGDCLHQPEKQYGYGDTATATFGASLEPGPEPPDYSSQLITLVTPVLWDAAPWGKEFGDCLHQPEKILGESILAEQNSYPEGSILDQGEDSSLGKTDFRTDTRPGGRDFTSGEEDIRPGGEGFSPIRGDPRSFQGASLEPGPEPPDYSSQLITLVTPVLWDAAPWGKEFGDCLHQPEKRYGYGDTATATFVAGNPRNSLRHGRGYGTVERLVSEQDDAWVVVATDADWETKYIWRRNSVVLGTSHAQLQWDIPAGTQPGTYRLHHYGNYKYILGGIYPYHGFSDPFEVS